MLLVTWRANRRLRRLASANELRGQVKEELAVVVRSLGKKQAQPMQKTRGIAFDSPSIVARFCTERSRGKRRRVLSFVEDLVERDFHGAGEFFQSVNGGDGVTVFDARDVAALQAGAALEFTLGNVLFFADGP